MRKIIILVFIGIAAFVSLSCDEDFNVEADFLERNVLNGIIRPDTTLQVVTVFHSYSAGNDPDNNTDFPVVKNADVKMWTSNEVYQFADTTMDSNPDPRYEEPFYYYYSSNLRPKEGDIVDVEALLPNGLLLSSLTIIPRASDVKIQQGSDIKVPPTRLGAFDEVIKDELKINWNEIGDKHYYLPRLYIEYIQKLPEGGSVTKQIEVPSSLRTTTNEDILTYPKPEFGTTITYLTSSINDTFRRIQEDGTEKSDYTIVKVGFDVMVYDENLSAYYSSTNLKLDSFSIKVNESDFTNIDGGFGIFGSIATKNFRLGLDEDYVRDLFGYSIIPQGG